MRLTPSINSAMSMTSFSMRASPASILAMSRMSVMMSNRCWPEARMSRTYSRYLRSPSGPSISAPMMSEKPMIEFKGVRNS